MSENKIFEKELPLPDNELSKRELGLLGFEERYKRISAQLRLLLNLSELGNWTKTHHGGNLAIIDLLQDQYPLVIFHGDVGTGKTATAECVANRLVRESGTEDSTLYKLSNRVRGKGMVGEMGTLVTDAFDKVIKGAGQNRRSILLIDEADSVGSSRTQEHSHHEDKVAVNTIIQGIDELRRYKGRVVVILCTNRLSVMDAAIMRRAAVVEEFKRPDDRERFQLFKRDLDGFMFQDSDIQKLVQLTGQSGEKPAWTYSDVRTRLYPAAIAQAFPNRPLTINDLLSAVKSMSPSPVLQD